jgi:phenylalanyl-tRNA synthetase beta chain
MKISRTWLQKYFDTPIPEAEVLGDALTFHAFEIESIENDILDVKITANRGHDCLSHRGIAKEYSAILQLPMTSDPLRQEIQLVPKTETVSVQIIDDSALSPRYIAGYLKGVKVGPSPEWLRKHLESIGQKSINNVVDATNFVMFDLGQPLHAFDAGQLQEKGGTYAIGVRRARSGEKIIALDDKEYTLADSMLVITDRHADAAIGIAGVKGGKPAGITETTRDIIIESANFSGISVRKTAAALKLRTDASSRFEQVISPELAAYGMRAVVELIKEIAGGELVGFADQYPAVQQQKSVSVDTARINATLGSKFSDADVASAFGRLDLPFTKMGETFVVEPPFERLDLIIPEDLIEEVGRIFGYDVIPEVQLPPLKQKPKVNANFYTAEKVREELTEKGYSEVFLRTNLSDGLNKALLKNLSNKDLLGLKEIKIFEIGTVWENGKEKINLAKIEGEKISEKPGVGKWIGTETELDEMTDVPDTYDDLALSTTERYQPFSKYPFIVRDIALWVPSATNADDVLQIIRMHAGDLLVRSEKFDGFKKGEKTSFAFRLVFQSFDKTLTDFDANERMESVSSALKAEGFEIR